MSSVAEPALAELATPATDAASGRYVRLDAVDRYAAETLNKFCQANVHRGQAASQLSNLAVLQAFVTAVPLAIADFVSLYISVFLTTGVVERAIGVPTTQVEHQTAFFISLAILPIAQLAGLYPGLGLNPIVEFRQIAASLFAALAVLAGIGWFCFPSQWAFYAVSAAIAFGLALPSAVTARHFARHLAKHFRWWGVPVFILAKPQHAVRMYHRLRTAAEQGFRPAGILLDPDQYWDGENPLRNEGVPVFDIRQTDEAALRHGVTWVIVSMCANRPLTPAMDSSLAAIPNRILLSSSQLDMGIWDRIYSVGATSGLRVAGVQPNGLKLLLKRCIDLAIATTVLLLGLPVWGLLYILVRATSPGPAFYGQRRIGCRGDEFTAWKMRTMYANADEVLEDYLAQHPKARAEWHETHKLANDPRVTPIGRFLRATSLDELPQLWNIVRGEMSLVGPRPIVDSPTYDRCYITNYPDEYAVYKTVRPGLTGLWQVRCRNRGVYELRIYHDMYYIRNWCIWLDLYLIMRTVKTVLFREGT